MKILLYEPDEKKKKPITAFFNEEGIEVLAVEDRDLIDGKVNELIPDLLYDIPDNNIAGKRQLSIIDYGQKAPKLIEAALLNIESDKDEMLKGLNLTLSLKKELEVYKEKLASELSKVKEARQALEKENELHQINIKELTETNQHLIAATWRERAIKQKLAQTLDELQQTKEVVEEQHRKISESIDYAQRIQKSVTPTKEVLKESFSQSFMLYKPKDVVSGDFPWIINTETHTYLAAVDCTGHGVPGAMLAIIGTLLLKEIVNKTSDPIFPNEVLDKLHEEVVETLNQKHEMNVGDGMDIALVRIDKERRSLDFAGAKRPLIHISGEDLQEIKGDRMPIGGVNYRKRTNYTNHTISLSPGDIVSFSSDGYIDQMNSADKKIGNRGLQALVKENGQNQFDQMQQILWSHFLEWQGDTKQLDDVLVIGIKI